MGLGERRPRERAQVDPQVAVEHDRHDPAGGPPEPVRILRSAHGEPGGQRAQQQIELVQDRQIRADIRPRQQGPAGQVLFAEGAGDRGGLPVEPGVDAADHPLELGKLPHHLRHQIGLAEPRGPLQVPGLCHIEGQRASQQIGQPGEALGLLGHRPQPLVDDQAGQLRDPGLQGALPVLFEEEPRIGEARAEHPFVSLAHRLEAAGSPVPHRHEHRKQLGAGIFDGKVLLVVLHDGDEDLTGKRQKLRREPAGEGFGPLHQLDGFLEEVGVQDRVPARAARRPNGRLGDPPAPRLRVEEDVSAAERRLEALGVLDRDRARAQDAVAVGAPARLDVREATGDDLAPEERHQPPHRPREADGLGTPAHRLGKRQPRGQRGQHLAERLDGGAARRAQDGKHVLALWGRPALQAGHGHSLRAREPLGGLGGPAVRRVRHARGGTAYLTDGVLLPERHLLDGKDDPPGCRPRGDRSAGDPGGAQRLGRHLPDLPGRGPCGGRGQFFGADLEDEPRPFVPGRFRRHARGPEAAASPSPLGGRGTGPRCAAPGRGTGPSAPPAPRPPPRPAHPAD